VVKALEQAKQVKGKPVCINIRTIIGLASKAQGCGSVHGAALGDDDVAFVKSQLGFSPHDKFVVPPKVYDYFADCKPRGAKAEAEWNGLMEGYKSAYPTEHAELSRRMAGKLREGWEKDVPTKDQLPKDAIPTRKASGIMVQALVPKDKTFTAGSADLIESTFVGWKGMTEFQKVSWGCVIAWCRVFTSSRPYHFHLHHLLGHILIIP